VVLCHVLWLICVLKSALRLCCISAPKNRWKNVWVAEGVSEKGGGFSGGFLGGLGVKRSVSSSDSVQNLCALQVSNYFYTHK